MVRKIILEEVKEVLIQNYDRDKFIIKRCKKIKRDLENKICLIFFCIFFNHMLVNLQTYMIISIYIYIYTWNFCEIKYEFIEAKHRKLN